MDKVFKVYVKSGYVMVGGEKRMVAGCEEFLVEASCEEAAKGKVKSRLNEQRNLPADTTYDLNAWYIGTMMR